MGYNKDSTIATSGGKQWRLAPIETLRYGAWKYFLPLSAKGNILYVGTKLNGPAALARHVREVQYLCCGREHLNRTLVDLDQTGVNNIVPVEREPSGRIPFPDRYFDGFAVQDIGDILENMPAGMKDGDFLFQELNRVLKTGGFYYVGIKKRNLKDVLQLAPALKLSSSRVARALPGD